MLPMELPKKDATATGKICKCGKMFANRAGVAWETQGVKDGKIVGRWTCAYCLEQKEAD